MSVATTGAQLGLLVLAGGVLFAFLVTLALSEPSAPPAPPGAPGAPRAGG